MHQGIADVLQARARRQPAAPFLVRESRPGVVETIRWQEQDLRARRAAAGLERLGVGRGGLIGIHLDNRPDFFDIWFAAAYLGAVVVPTNPASTVTELEYVLRHSGCRVVVTQPDLVDKVRSAGAQVLVDVGEDWSAGHEPYDGPPQAGGRDDLAVLYTSGTTSAPKGVVVSHAAFLAAGDTVAGHIRLRPDDRILVVLPLFHGNAMYYCAMSALVTGASIGLAPRFSATRWAQQASVLEATVASLFAAPIRMLLAHEPDTPRPQRLRLTLYAQNISAKQIAEFERRYGGQLVQLYGMTETVVPPTIGPLYEPRPDGSMGRAVVGARLRIVDENGADVAFGEPGELLVEGVPGVTMMTGYLSDATATESVMRDGWLHTGDIVTRDRDGYLYFVDRAKDMIKRAGENVSCGEIERVVGELADVLESAAVGVPDAMRDEAIHLYVVPKPGRTVAPETVLAQCRRHLAKFKVPDEVHIVDTLPRTSVGKIRKQALRRSAQGESTPGNEER
ncbi:AMP-binding protein [Mycolicibacterium thermoresistibile]